MVSRLLAALYRPQRGLPYYIDNRKYNITSLARPVPLLASRMAQ